MKENNDINNAAFIYSLNMLGMLLKMRIITEEEYNKITNISAEFYGVKNLIFS